VYKNIFTVFSITSQQKRAVVEPNDPQPPFLLPYKNQIRQKKIIPVSFLPPAFLFLRCSSFSAFLSSSPAFTETPASFHPAACRLQGYQK
jgi:hypothetical protein